MTTYAAVAQAGSNNVADLTDTFDDLDAFKASGAKMITVVGANDGLIMPRGVINYYRVMAARYAEGSDHDPLIAARFAVNDHDLFHDPSDRFRGIQKFYRLFHAPGVSHCGLGILNHESLGPWPQSGADFNAVINWVEKGVAPSQVIGSGNTAAPAFIPGSPTTLTRPLCPYPQTAVYNGSGNINDAASWHCGGELEKNIPVGTPLSGSPGQPVACYDVLVKYKHEVNGPLDYRGQRRQPGHLPHRRTARTLMRMQTNRDGRTVAISESGKTTAGVRSDAHACFRTFRCAGFGAFCFVGLSGNSTGIRNSAAAILRCCRSLGR